MKQQTGGQSLPSVNEEKPLPQKQLQVPAATPLPPKLPLTTLIEEGSRQKYIEIGVPLYDASITGDWKTAKGIFETYPEMNLVRCSITENCETPLHVAASAKETKKVVDFVINLVMEMNKEDLTLQNLNHNTALYLAAAAGNYKTVRILVEKYKVSMTIPGGAEVKMMPLYAAALFGSYMVVKYLYEHSKNLRDDGWTTENRRSLLEKCVDTDMFDIALKILEDHPSLVSSGNVLGVLARKPHAFAETKSYSIRKIINSAFTFFGLKPIANEKPSDALELLRIIWKDIVKKPRNEIDDIIKGPPTLVKENDKSTSGKIDKALQPLTNISNHFIKIPATKEQTTVNKKYSSGILFVAAKMDNTKFIVEIIRKYPDLIWKVNDNNQSIFHVAVKYRHEGIYNLLYELGAMKDLITPLEDNNKNNMLHLVGIIAKKKRLRDITGAAMQMQRELLWFKEVETMIPPSYRDRKNKQGLTPYALFIKEHNELLKQGEAWMKETASQCIVVAALVATIVFAAAFTIPGGYNQDDGIPLFYREVAFRIFVVADAISLFSSSTSILMFLSILTSRYAERDFLDYLPDKLVTGLATLFYSIASMMITFSVSFFLLYHQNLKWIPTLISNFAALPILAYIVLNFPFMTDVYLTTYGIKNIFKPNEKVLYYENPKW